MKKIIYLLIAVFILLSASAFTVTADDAVDERIKVVADLGLVDGDDSGDLMLDKDISRAEMATLVYRLRFGNSPTLASKQVFGDVDSGHWAAGEIEILYGNNIISGDGNGNFRPDDSVSAAELYKMLLYVAGYGEYVSTVGQYPSNVMITASDTELSKGVSFEADKALTRAEAFIILYNLLEVKIMEAVEITANGASYKEGQPFMTSHLDIYKGKGTLTAVSGISSDGNDIPEGMAVIDGITYENEAGIGAESIGLWGEFYYSDEPGSERVLLSFVPLRNEVLELNVRDIIGYSSNVYTYRENSREKRIKLDPGKDIYYNGHTVLSELYNVEVPRFDSDGDPVIDEKTGLQIIDKTEKTYMLPVYGNVKLTDNNRDGLYDVVMIEEYQNILCDYVSEETETIYAKIDGVSSRVELSELDEYTITDKSGSQVSLRKITENTLVMLQYYDNRTGLKITICDENAEGNISSVGYNEYDERTVTLDGIEYTLASSVAWGTDKLTINSGVTLLKDKFGNIGAIIPLTSKSKWKYGYVLDINYPDDDFEAMPSIVIFETNGSSQEYKCAKTVRLDDFPANSEAVSDAVKYGSVIRYLLNAEQEIRMIDTAEALDITEWESDVSENNALLERISAENQMCKTSNMAFFGSRAIFYDADTLFLQVPKGITSFDPQGIYLRRTTSNLVHKGIYDIKAYNTDPEDLTADLIVIYDQADEIANGAHALVIKKIVPYVDDEGENTYRISGFLSGQGVSYTLKDPSLMNVGNHRLEMGDVIRIRVVSGRITNVQLMYSINDPQAESKLGPSSTYFQSTNWNAEFKMEFGHVERVQVPNIVFKRSGSDEGTYGFFNAVKYFNIYIYDETKPDNEIVSMGSIYDIKSREQYPNEYDTVICGAESSNGTMLLLIRNND